MCLIQVLKMCVWTLLLLLTREVSSEVCSSASDCSSTSCAQGHQTICRLGSQPTTRDNGTCSCTTKVDEIPAAVCEEAMFMCESSPLVCVEEDLKCNGISECANGADESVEICGCLPNEFACNTTTCIDGIKRCDRNADCENGEDELNCETYICPDTHSKCHNFFCIPNEARCNFVDDCGDNSDEDTCERRTCYETEFRCNNEDCIPEGFLCDGHPHCLDGSDEINCGVPYRPVHSYQLVTCVHSISIGGTENHESHGGVLVLCSPITDNRISGNQLVTVKWSIVDTQHFSCEEGYYIQRQKVCDGWIDCRYSQMDETNCGNCTGDRFRCNNGRCIRNSNVCDGYCDCDPACEDEKECDPSICNSVDKYICRDTLRCIDRKYLCDDVNDCWNSQKGGDEYFCFNDSVRCGKVHDMYGGVFRCDDGKCLPGGDRDSLACDHHVDCKGGEDEENCETKPCDSSQFSCDNGQCIPYELRCDGIANCFDRSDEFNCQTLECNYGTSRCKSSGACIPKEYWCDHFQDCPDSSDETNCPSNYTRSCQAHEFRCNNGQCIDGRYECDGSKEVQKDRKGCADKSHLLKCRNYTCNLDTQYKCHRSFCISQSELCDRHPDCTNGFTADDEHNCSFTCPDPAHVCICRNLDMDCEHRNLTKLPDGVLNEAMTTYWLAGNNISITETTFRGLSRLDFLNLTHNHIRQLPVGAFKSLWRLTKLVLEDNMIDIIQNGTFLGLTSLREINFRGNRIRSLYPEAFIGLSQLHVLQLDNQNLQRLNKNTFQGLRNVRALDLSHNHISVIEEGAFSGLGNLISLDLSHNEILMVRRYVFNGLSAMEFLDISQNVIDIIEDNSFDGLHSLKELITDEFRFCCVAKITGKCLPEPDEFSSCTDLMSNFVLRVSIWVLGLVAFWGNLVVVIWRVRDVRNGKVHSFLITNLAIGDLFMGVYMMIIAVVDAYYRGKYIQYDKNWRESDLCKFAGFISTFSSELSVFTLTVITLDRLICIIFPLHLRRPKLRDAAFVMMWIWLIVLLISGLPLVGLDYFENFYGRSGVCLAFHITNTKPNGWEYSVAVFLVLNFISFLIIFFSYLRMFFVAKKTRSAVRNPQDKNDSAMAKRMTLIVMTDFFCWVPIILMGFASLGGAKIPIEIYAWVAVFILPLNSAINPVLYTICTAPFLRHFRKRASYFRKSFTGSTKNDTKHSFLDERSTHIMDRKPIYRHLELMRMRSFNNKPFSHSHVHSTHTDNLL